MRTLIQTYALWLCRHGSGAWAVGHSDGDEGPDDGVNHVHPERVFHFDLTLAGIESLDCD